MRTALARIPMPVGEEDFAVELGEGAAAGTYKNGTITLNTQKIVSLANLLEIDLYTFTQNVFLHEQEHHRSWRDYQYYEDDVYIGKLWADWERDTQKKHI